MPLSVIPIKVQRKEPGFDLYASIVGSLGDMALQSGDVIVISSKYVASSKNRLLDLQRVKPSAGAASLSGNHQLDPRFAEVVLRESDKVFGGVAGFVLTSADSVLAPNAGIDKSNVKKGTVILYPDEPYLVAEQLRRKLFLDFGVHVGIILADSRLMPARAGTVGVAIACAGLEPVHDVRGSKDLDGNPLKVTLKATADNLASIANHKMGEGDESTPIAIVRDSGAKLTTRKIRPDEMAVSSEQCVYFRGFGNWRVKNTTTLL